MAKQATPKPLRVLIAPHPTLTAVCKPIEFINREIRLLAERMLAAMHEGAGIGLAAPQVGKRLRMVVLNVGEGDHIYLNPRILGKSNFTVSEEGCLSLPGVMVSLTRHDTIRVRAFGLDGLAFEQVAHGLAAIVLQHEIDHLDGRLILP